MNDLFELIQIGFDTMLNIDRPYCSAEAFYGRMAAIEQRESERLIYMYANAELSRDITFFN